MSNSQNQRGASSSQQQGIGTAHADQQHRYPPPQMYYYPMPAHYPTAPNGWAPIPSMHHGFSVPSMQQQQAPVSEEDYWLNVALQQSSQEFAEQQRHIHSRAAFSAHSHSASMPARPTPKDVSKKSQAEALSYKYWSTGSLGYTDLLIDSFYMLHGEFPEISTNPNKFPSLEALRKVFTTDSREVVLIDAEQDSSLLALLERAKEATEAASSPTEKVQALARLVSDYYGGKFDCSEGLMSMWQVASASEKRVRRSVVILLGRLSVGAGRHRALLFKLLADSLPKRIRCQLLIGQYVHMDDGVVCCLVSLPGVGEMIVDLVREPGTLVTPEAARSHLCGEGSMLIPPSLSPLNLCDGGSSTNLTNQSSLSSKGTPGALIQGTSSVNSDATVMYKGTPRQDTPSSTAETSSKPAAAVFSDLIQLDSGTINLPDSPMNGVRSPPAPPPAPAPVPVPTPPALPTNPALGVALSLAVPGASADPNPNSHHDSSQDAKTTLQHESMSFPQLSASAAHPPSHKPSPSLDSTHVSNNDQFVTRLMVRSPFARASFISPSTLPSPAPSSSSSSYENPHQISGLSSNISAFAANPPLSSSTQHHKPPMVPHVDVPRGASAFCTNQPSTSSVDPFAELSPFHHHLPSTTTTISLPPPFAELSPFHHLNTDLRTHSYSGVNNSNAASSSAAGAGPSHDKSSNARHRHTESIGSDLSLDVDFNDHHQHHPHALPLNQKSESRLPVVRSALVQEPDDGQDHLHPHPHPHPHPLANVPNMARGQGQMEASQVVGASARFLAPPALSPFHMGVPSPYPVQDHASSSAALAAAAQYHLTMAMQLQQQLQQHNHLLDMGAPTHHGLGLYPPMMDPGFMMHPPGLGIGLGPSGLGLGPSVLQQQFLASQQLSRMPSLRMGDTKDWEIKIQDLEFGQRIGIGSYGEVYKGKWRGTEVAIKRLLEQKLSPSTVRDFRLEVNLLSKLRHPNIVLFLGAVTTPPQLAIITNFISRGSLFRLLHRTRVDIDPKRRLSVALDIAKGMNHLHSCTPPVVHRDLKSPNLLVDKDWSVKVCDFGEDRGCNRNI